MIICNVDRLCFTSYKLWSGVCNLSSWDSRWWPLHLLLVELYIRAVVWVWWSVCHPGPTWDCPKLWSLCPLLQVSNADTIYYIFTFVICFTHEQTSTCSRASVLSGFIKVQNLLKYETKSLSTNFLSHNTVWHQGLSNNAGVAIFIYYLIRLSWEYRNDQE